MPVEDAYDDTNSIVPSNFDIERLESLSFGDSLDAENGNWRVLKYHSGWTLLLNNHVRQKDYLEFKSLTELLEFLKNK